MNRGWFAAVLVVALAACGTSDTGRNADAPDDNATPAESPAAAANATQGGGTGADLIRDVRVNPGTTTVEITFTAVPGAFASVVIGETPPQSMALHPALASAEGMTSVLVLDPERQVAGYVVRSSTASYVLNTARDEPDEDSTHGLNSMRAGTTYHFIISVPPRAARPGEDEDDLPMGAQHAGSFTTRR